MKNKDENIEEMLLSSASLDDLIRMKIETELCAFSLEACRAAARAGVTRVELCASPNEGGTTPSAALIRRARQIPHLQLSVMIRPRGGDFLYTDDEFDLMLDEVDFARECGADCVVAGMLTPDGRVDEERTAAHDHTKPEERDENKKPCLRFTRRIPYAETGLGRLFLLRLSRIGTALLYPAFSPIRLFTRPLMPVFFLIARIFPGADFETVFLEPFSAFAEWERFALFSTMNRVGCPSGKTALPGGFLSEK